MQQQFCFVFCFFSEPTFALFFFLFIIVLRVFFSILIIRTYFFKKLEIIVPHPMIFELLVMRHKFPPSVSFFFFSFFSPLPAVGKSAILLQFTERQFRDAHDMTIGVEFGAKDVCIGDAQVCPRCGLI